jgi:hypothetical protein
MNQFVLIEGQAYNVNTTEEIDAARAALVACGKDSAKIWYGEPGDPSAYPSTVHKLFASPAKQRGVA